MINTRIVHNVFFSVFTPYMDVYTPAELLFIARINETRKFKFPSPNENKFALNTRYFSARDLHSLGDFRLQYYLNRFSWSPSTREQKQETKNHAA